MIGNSARLIGAIADVFGLQSSALHCGAEDLKRIKRIAGKAQDQEPDSLPVPFIPLVAAQRCVHRGDVCLSFRDAARRFIAMGEKS